MTHKAPGKVFSCCVALQIQSYNFKQSKCKMHGHFDVQQCMVVEHFVT